MVKVGSNIRNWEEEQMSYFREYMGALSPSSKEYHNLKNSIAVLGQGE